MSKADGENFDPKELDLPDDDVLQPADEAPEPEETIPEVDFGDLGPVPLDGVAEEVAEEGEDKDVEKESDVEPKKRKLGLSAFLAFAVCGVSCLGLVLLDLTVFKDWGILFMGFMNLFWLIGTLVPFMLWLGRQTNNFYEVMLSISLVAILIAVMILLIELVTYNGDIKANEAKQRAALTPAVQSASPNTTAAA